MPELLSLLIYAVAFGLIGYALMYKLVGRGAWVGGVIGIVLGIYVVYPGIVDLPTSFWTQFLYSYENLDSTDFWAPTNATFILYLAMFAYLGCAALAIINGLSKRSFQLGG